MNAPDYPRMIRPRDREFDSNGEYEYQEYDLKDSDLRVHLTHRPDGDSAIVLAREGETQAALIADTDDEISVKVSD